MDYQFVDSDPRDLADGCAASCNSESDHLPGARSLRVSLIIPAYNEEATIERAVLEADAALSEVASEYEIILVDDGSTDATGALATRLGKQCPNLRLLGHESNQGYGAALRTGLAAAQFDCIVSCNAACRFDLRQLDYLLPLTRWYDLVCGCRMPGAGLGLQHGLSRVYNFLINSLIEPRVHDVDCALKVFQRKHLSLIMPESAGYAASAEMLHKARQAQLKVVEVGVQEQSRAGGQSKTSWQENLRTLVAVLPMWWARSMFPAGSASATRIHHPSWTGLLVIACLAAALLFPKLSYPFVEPDEGRYGEIAREMAHSRDWIVPTLNYDPYLDKPPLLYWLTAASVQAFGVHTWSIRIVPALAAFATILVTYWFSSRILSARIGFLAGLSLTLMVGFVQCGRFVIIDNLLTLLETLALFMGFEALRGKSLHWAWWLSSALVCSLAILAKGPIAVICILVPLAAFVWLNKNSQKLGLRPWLLWLLLAMGLAAPWFLVMMFRQGDFAWQFVLEHHLMRFFGSEYHDEPMWFYLPVLMVGCLPWSLYLFPLCQQLFGRFSAPLRPPALGFFVLWSGWMFLFFSLSRGKLPTYLLPMTPAVAVLLGWYFDLFLFQVPARLPRFPLLVSRFTAAVLCLGWFGGVLWAWSSGLIFDAAGRRWMAAESCLCLAAVLIAVIRGRKILLPVAWGLCAILGFGLLLALTQDLVPAYAVRRTPLAKVAKLFRHRPVSIVNCGDEWGSLPFALDSDDDYFHTKRWSKPEFQAFVAARLTTLVFTKEDTDRQAIRQALPPNMHVANMFPSGKSMVMVVEPISRQAK
jgi:dolichol-phosphate mannosyltransferase